MLHNLSIVPLFIYEFVRFPWVYVHKIGLNVFPDLILIFNCQITSSKSKETYYK